MLTPRKLVEDFRREVDDPLIPGEAAPDAPDRDSLWKSGEILGYINEAQREVARHTWLLRGSVTLDVVADDPLVEAPEDLMVPRRARLLQSRVVLGVRNLNEMSMDHLEDYGRQGLSTWEEARGRPRFVCFDDAADEIRLVPEPTEDDTLELKYFRWPAEVQRETGTLDVRRPEYKRALLCWMKHLAYRKQDADALDLQRSDMFERDFEMEISKVYGEVRRRTRRAGNVRYGGL